MSRTEREKRSAKRKQPVNLYLQRVTVKVYQHATNTKCLWQILDREHTEKSFPFGNSVDRRTSSVLWVC